MNTGIIKMIVLIVMVSVISLSSGDIFGQSDEMEDVVYLKSGHVFRGKILEQVVGQSIKIETRDGSVFVFPMDEVSRIAKEPKGSATAADEAGPTGRRRDPTAAGVLSFIIPGAGQVYNGEYAKAALHFGMFYAGAIIAISNMDWDFIWGETDGFEGNSGLLFLGSALALGGMIWSVVDAPKSANRINKENGWVVLPGVSDDLYLTMTDLRVDGRLTPGVKVLFKF